MSKGGAAAGPRLAVALAVLVVALLLAEGALSLLTGRSLRELLGPGSRRTWRGLTNNERAEVAQGLWRIHEDPLVGFTYRTDAELTLLDGRVTTDHLGLRRRVGGPAPDDALVVLVMGDSVAAGWGVDDDQTLAHHLEHYLASVAEPGARPVVARTVAVPGWNHRNAAAFLRNHLDELDPDIVLYMPINNDLANTYSVWETGHRRDAPDIATPDPWLRVSTDQTRLGALELWRRLELAGRGAEVDPERLGPQVLTADLSAESRRRYDENAASIADLAGVMSARGGHLALLQYTEGTYEWILWSRLDDRGLDVPVLPLLAHVPAQFTLSGDPHPSAETQRVFALWCARALIQRGWVGGRRPDDLPAAPPAYEELRAQVHAAGVRHQRAEAERIRLRAQLKAGYDGTTGEGLYQVYGGLNPDGSARRSALLLLPRVGDVVELALGPLRARPDLYPLAVTVELDGVPLQTLEVVADRATRARIELPADGSGEPFELRLRAERVVVTTYGGLSQLSAYRLLSARCARSP